MQLCTTELGRSQEVAWFHVPMQRRLFFSEKFLVRMQGSKNEKTTLLSHTFADSTGLSFMLKTKEYPDINK